MTKQIQKIFILGIVGIFFSFLLASNVFAACGAGEFCATLSTGTNTGVDITTQNCAAVLNGTLAPDYPTCTLTCNAGYALSGGACIASGGGGGGGGSTPPATLDLGCSGGNLYNTSTGALCVNNAVPQGCSGGNLYNTSTGALCINNVEIPGCGNKTTGFSSASGVSCVNNRVTSATTTYNFGTTTLKNGSKGAAVMELQRFLNAKLNLGLVVDGKLGPKTIAVIKKWQKDHGLVADGLVGAKTKAKMHLEE
jgi:hypothetical protein